MEIMMNQTLEMNNVLSYRDTMSYQQMQQKLQDVALYIKKQGIETPSSYVTATHSTKEQGVADVEFLFPLDRKPNDIIEGYSWKERFLLTNALVISHEGNPGMLDETIAYLDSYMQKNNMIPISSGYTVVTNCVSEGIKSVKINIYVSISPNIL